MCDRYRTNSPCQVRTLVLWAVDGDEGGLGKLFTIYLTAGHICSCETLSIFFTVFLVCVTVFLLLCWSIVDGLLASGVPHSDLMFMYIMNCSPRKPGPHLSADSVMLQCYWPFPRLSFPPPMTYLFCNWRFVSLHALHLSFGHQTDTKKQYILISSLPTF